MKIIFATYIGFCSGVKRAIAIAEKSLKEGKKPVFFLGSLVHNEKVIERFENKGIRFVKSLKDSPGTVIIQAHGIPPLKQMFKKVILRDATCPLVRKAQMIAERLYENGHQVIIIGDKHHAETKGIKGYAKNKAIIIENKDEVKKINLSQKIGVVVQTTQTLKNVREILKELKKNQKKLSFFNTLCPEVQNRQKELSSILKKCDGLLVLGSRSSANTRRLVLTAKRMKKKAFWVNSLEEIKRVRLNNLKVLGVVSGTSTPDWEINKIKKWLKERKQK